MYIWESKHWPRFDYNPDDVKSRLENVLVLQQKLIGKAKSLPEHLDLEAELDALVQDAIQTSQIEGEDLDVASVRSSVAKHLGLEQVGLPAVTRQTECLVAMLCNATSDLQQPITQQKLCEWQAAIFPEPSLINDIAIGDLRGDAPMQVVSRKGRREIIHFEAPPKRQLKQELDTFINWFNLKPPSNMHGIVRAAISHLWLITLHPFDDGNGRVTRALTDRALAQDEQTIIRFYSLSAAVEQNRTAYYDILEKTQSGKTITQESSGNDTDVTEWINWFLDILAQAMKQGVLRVERVINKARFWKIHSQTVLSARQIKILNRLLDGEGEEFVQGINTSKYKNLTAVSKATATRDLAELVTKGCIIKLPEGGRSTRYILNLE